MTVQTTNPYLPTRSTMPLHPNRVNGSTAGFMDSYPPYLPITVVSFQRNDLNEHLFSPYANNLTNTEKNRIYAVLYRKEIWYETRKHTEQYVEFLKNPPPRRSHFESFSMESLPSVLGISGGLRSTTAQELSEIRAGIERGQIKTPALCEYRLVANKIQEQIQSRCSTAARR